MKKKKLVFFLETNNRLTGMQLTMLHIAAYLADHTSYQVFFVNNVFEDDLKNIESSSLNICDVNTFDFSRCTDAVFIIPINYLFFFLARTNHLSIDSARLILYFYDEFSLKKLFAQAKISCQKNSFLSIIKGSNSYFFSDRRAYNAVSADYGCFYENFLPMTIPNDDRSFAARDLINNSINIAYWGDINSKDVNAIMVVANNLLKYNMRKKIFFHIIGEAGALLKRDFSSFSPTICFVFTGKIDSKELEKYLKDNVDIVISNDYYALKAASLNLPVVIPITSIAPQNDNRYVYLFDIQGYQYDWDRQGLLATNNKMYNFYDILREIYLKKRKINISNACYDYYLKNIDIKSISKPLLSVISKSELTIKKVKSAELSIRQMKCFSDFKKNTNSTYKEFLEQYGVKKRKENIIKKSTIKEQLLDFKHTIERRKKIKEFLSVQKSFKEKKEKIKNIFLSNQTIRVAFIVVFNSVFPTRPIFELMLKDSIFDPYIIVAPNISRSFRYQMQLYNEAFDSLNKEYPGKVINGYNKEKDTYFELKDDFSIIFFCNPYKHLVHPFHEIEYFTKKDVLTLYASYGFAALKFWDEVIATDFYNYLWKACTETQSNLNHLKSVQAIKGINGFVSGYIKVDKMAKIIPSIRSRKRIIISPHHTVWGWKTLNISNFLKYKDFFIELPKLFPQIDFIFRPHPLLFANLKAYKHWTQQEVDLYLENILKNENVIYDNSGEYFDKFINSDALIHDCGSFIGEYLFTEKPCCYMMRSLEETMDGLVPLGQQCMLQHYHAFTETDIINFIQNVVVDGIDPLKEKREAFVRSELKKNYPNAAETVVKMIKKELNINEEK